jgi:hypothetical protein
MTTDTQSSADEIGEGGCKPEVEDQEQIDFHQNLQEYRKLRLAIFSVLMLSLISSCLLWTAWLRGSFTGHASGVWYMQLLVHRSEERLIFIGYLLISVWMWAVYYLSIFNSRMTKVNSLRRLLLIFADAWSDKQVVRDTEFAPALLDKSRASMTMLAMLTAAAALLLTRAIDRLAVLDQNGEVLVDTWEQVLAYCAGGASAIALICFVISVDSLDVLFNPFGKKASYGHNHLINYFYRSTRNSRYYGIMFLLWAVCLFCGARNPLFGAFVVAITITTGWSHWFPMPLSESQISTFSFGRFVSVLKWLLGAVLVLLPPAWAILM